MSKESLSPRSQSASSDSDPLARGPIAENLSDLSPLRSHKPGYTSSEKTVWDMTIKFLKGLVHNKPCLP